MAVHSRSRPSLDESAEFTRKEKRISDAPARRLKDLWRDLLDQAVVVRPSRRGLTGHSRGACGPHARMSVP
jgi:hypothetical protein